MATGGDVHDLAVAGQGRDPKLDSHDPRFRDGQETCLRGLASILIRSGSVTKIPVQFVANRLQLFSYNAQGIREHFVDWRETSLLSPSCLCSHKLGQSFMQERLGRIRRLRPKGTADTLDHDLGGAKRKR